jgi:glyoxylase-like metal-dependent hydrolase (beta-lactamase superfamily II)
MEDLNRRSLLAGAAAALAGSTTPSQASAPVAGKQGAAIYRQKVGKYELTALYDGTWFRVVDDTFVRNASAAEVDKALTDAFLHPRVVPTSFTALLVNTGSKLVLIDTGTGGQFGSTSGFMDGALASAGVRPDQIDIILISHFHADHINGIKDKDGNKVFPKAEIKVAAAEWAYWMDEGRLNAAPDSLRTVFLNARRIFRDIAGEVTRFDPGGEVAPGITSIAAYGHTPGHTAFTVSSGNQSMLVLGDVTNHPWLFARHPEWQGSFDSDGPMAVETRKRMLDRAAADKLLVQGYHFPFPASGYIRKAGGGYEVVPAMWQPL